MEDQPIVRRGSQKEIPVAVDTTGEVKTGAREIGQVGLGKETKLKDRDERHLDLALHLHFAGRRSQSRYRQRQFGDVGQQAFVGTGSDGSNLHNRFSTDVGDIEAVLGISDVGNHGLVIGGTQPLDIGDRGSQDCGVKQTDVGHHLLHACLSTVKSLCALHIGDHQPGLRVDQIHGPCGYPGQEQDDQHG